MALDTQTKRILWSGLRAGATVCVAAPASMFGIFLVLVALRGLGLSDSTGFLAPITILLLLTGPILASYAALRLQHRTFPFAVLYPENSLTGLLWGLVVSVAVFKAEWAGAGGFALCLSFSTVAALVTRRILWLGLIFSPIPFLYLHILMTPFGGE